MLQIEEIVNITLTASMQEVTVDTSQLYAGYVCNTKDSTDFEISLTSDGDSFLCSENSDTSPLNIRAERDRPGNNPIVFYVKGTIGSIFQIMFIKE